MAQIIILGGNSIKNKSWIYELKENFNDISDKVHVLDYHHWETKEGMISFSLEVKKLFRLSEGMNDYIIIAKSAGCIVTLMALKENLIKPSACVFLGFPLLWAKELNINLNDLLSYFNCPSVIIQNSNDPAGAFLEVKEFLTNNNFAHGKIIELVGNTHDYKDFNKIKESTLSLFNN
jgi:predicted alpha/beta-hydrolase family hydrolase